MSRQFGIVNVASFTFDNWISRDNDIIRLVNTDVVTTASNTAGDITVGNGYVIGIFGSNTLTANTLRGGNVTHSTTLTISSNATFSGQQVNSAANIYFSSANVYIKTANATTIVGNTLFNSNASNQVLKLISNTTNVNVSMNANTLYITSNVFASNTLSVNGAVTFANTLDVTGNTTLVDLRASYSNVDTADVTTIFSVGANFVANTTAAKANQFLVGSFATTGGVIANTTHVIVGNSSVNTVITDDTVTANTINAYNVEFYNSSKGANGYFNKLTGANLSVATIYTGNIEVTSSSYGVNGYFNSLTGVTGSTVNTFTLNSNVVTTNTILVGNTTSGVNGYFKTLTAISGNGVINANTVNAYNIEVTNSSKGVNGYYYSLTGNSITSYSITTTNMSVLGTLIGTFAPTGSFIPGTNNIYQIGTSSNVFLSAYATTIATNTINTQSGLLTVAGNVALTGTQLSTAASLTATGTYNFSAWTSGSVAIDTFDKTVYRTAEYTLQFTETSTSSYHVTKIIVYHDGTTAYSAEYAQLYNNSSVATITVDVSSNNVRILAVPSSAGVIVKFSKNLLVV